VLNQEPRVMCREILTHFYCIRIAIDGQQSTFWPQVFKDLPTVPTAPKRPIDI